MPSGPLAQEISHIRSPKQCKEGACCIQTEGKILIADNWGHFSGISFKLPRA